MERELSSLKPLAGSLAAAVTARNVHTATAPRRRFCMALSSVQARTFVVSNLNRYGTLVHLAKKMVGKFLEM